MEPLEFYDLKKKQKFTTTNYKVEVKNGRRFAMAISPNGTKAARILGKA